MNICWPAASWLPYLPASDGMSCKPLNCRRSAKTKHNRRTGHCCLAAYLLTVRRSNRELREMLVFRKSSRRKPQETPDRQRKSIVLTSIAEPSLVVVVESSAEHGSHGVFDRLIANGFHMTMHDDCNGDSRRCAGPVGSTLGSTGDGRGGTDQSRPGFRHTGATSP